MGQLTIDRVVRILQVESPSRGAQGDHVYRTLQPCRALGELPGVRVASGPLLSPAVNQRLASADVLVLCDVVDADLLPVIEARRRAGRPTVYEINDHFRAPQGWSQTAYLAENLLTRSLSAQLAAHADAVQVTVPELHASFADLNPRQLVLPNQLWALPERQARPPGEVVWLGWGGSLGHREDLRWVTPVLQRTLERHPQVRLAVMGPEALWPLFDWVPPGRLRRVSGGSIDRYYEFLRTLDVGLCPLLPTDFNRCRSDVKFLELAAHGVTAVCSDLAPYRDSVRDGENGLLFRTLDELELALGRLLGDAGLRARLADSAYRSIAGRIERAHVGARLSLYRELGGDQPPAAGGDGDWPALEHPSFEGSRYEKLGGGPLEQTMYEGLVLARDGETDEAARRFREATRRAPSFYRAWLRLGTTSPNPREAVRALREARRLAPGSPSVALALAGRLEQAGRLDEARSLLETTRALTPHLGAAEVRLAALVEKAGDSAAARALYQAALDANPNYAEPVVRLAMSWLTVGDPASALALLERARVNDPDLWWFEFLTGRAQLESGQAATARGHLERALDRAPDPRPVLAQLARVYVALGDLTAARAAIDQAQGTPAAP